MSFFFCFFLRRLYEMYRLLPLFWLSTWNHQATPPMGSSLGLVLW